MGWGSSNEVPKGSAAGRACTHSAAMACAPKLALLPLNWCTSWSTSLKSGAGAASFAASFSTLLAESSKYSSTTSATKSGLEASCAAHAHSTVSGKGVALLAQRAKRQAARLQLHELPKLVVQQALLPQRVQQRLDLAIDLLQLCSH